MGIAEDMRLLAEEIVTSYESRLSSVVMIIDGTHQILEDFKGKRSEIRDQLKANLANGESLRKKDFDNMMKDILFDQDEREKKVKALLRGFLEEQKKIAEVIKRNLAEGEKVRIDDFKETLKDIQAKQRAREVEVSMALKGFQQDHKEMAALLSSFLHNGEAKRIKEFKEMLKQIRLAQIERAKEVRVKVNEFKEERQEMAAQWRKLTINMANKRAGTI